MFVYLYNGTHIPLSMLISCLDLVTNAIRVGNEAYHQTQKLGWISRQCAQEMVSVVLRLHILCANRWKLYHALNIIVDDKGGLIAQLLNV